MGARYEAKVVRVFDGDTIEVEIKKGSKKTIRFFGIDSPERTQEFGKEAREMVKSLIDKKVVEIFPVELGIYGREIGIVYINGISISEIMLKEGLAFASGNNHKLATKYNRYQEQSRVNKIGMWKQGFVENPSAYRRRNKSLFKKAFVGVKSTESREDIKVNNEVLNLKINEDKKEPSKSLFQYLKEIIHDITKEDRYISDSEFLKKIKRKPKV